MIATDRARPEASSRRSQTPYVGLVPYGEEDADFFFGREEEVEIVAANLRASRLTIVYGASGVGKTSLMHAGVVRRLREQSRAQSTGQRKRAPLAVCVFAAWRDDPIPGLAGAMRTAVTEVLGETDLAPWQRGTPLIDVVRKWSEHVRSILVVLDQFEDYFLYHDENGGEGTFDAELAALVNEPNLRVNFVISIREDAWAKLDRFEGRIASLFSNYIRIEHLDREAARMAIERPIAEWNRRLPPGVPPYTIQPELVEAVVDAAATAGELAGRQGPEAAVPEPGRRESIEAPFLQLVLERLWHATEAAGARSLDLARLQSLGGAERIVERHLHDALASLTPREQACAAELFRFLVTRSKTKIAHAPSDLAEWSERPQSDVIAVLDKLCRGESGRILRRVPPPAGSQTMRYELFHDVLAEPILQWRQAYERRSDRRRFLLVSAGLFALVAAFAALGGWALVQRSDARRHASTALLERSRAEQQAKLAQSRELAANAVSQLADDPELSLVLALDAERVAPTSQAEDALRQALLASRVRRTLRGAAGAVTSATFSPDGQTILTSSVDGSARIYSAGGRLLHVLRDGSPVTATAFSPNGKLVSTTVPAGSVDIWEARTDTLLLELRTKGEPRGTTFSSDGGLVAAGDASGASVWSTLTGRIVAALPQPGGATGVALSPRGSEALVVDEDGVARLWRVHDHHLLALLRAGGRVRAVAFSPKGTIVMTVLHATVRLWSAATGAPLKTLVDTQPSHAAVAGSSGSTAGEAAQVEHAAFSPDGRSVVTASLDGAARIFDVASGRRTAIFYGHTGFVTDAAFSPDGKWIVTASTDRTARVWQASGEAGVVLAGHRDTIDTASFNADGSRVVTASDDGTARVWDSGILPALQLVGRQPPSVAEAVPSPDGRLAASAGADGTVRIWRLADRQELRILHQGGSVATVTFSRNGKLILSAGADGSAKLWNAGSGLLLRVLQTGAPLSTASFSPDGSRLLAGGTDGIVRVWRTRGGGAAELRLGARVLAAGFSPDGTTILTAGEHGVVRLWRASDGTRLRDLTGHHGAVVHASFSPDGTLAATAGADGTARIWRVSDGRLLHVLRGHLAALTDVEFSPDGSRVVTTSFDHDARLWDVASGALLDVLRGHFAVVSGATFSPDGRWIVTAGPGTAGLWPAESGRLLEYLRGHTAPLTSAAFTPDSRRIVTASTDGTIRSFDCQVCGTTAQLQALAHDRLEATGRVLTPQERRRYLPH